MIKAILCRLDKAEKKRTNASEEDRELAGLDTEKQQNKRVCLFLPRSEISASSQLSLSLFREYVQLACKIQTREYN